MSCAAQRPAARSFSKVCGVQKNTRLSEAHASARWLTDTAPVSSVMWLSDSHVASRHAPICWATRGRVGARNTIFPGFLNQRWKL
eukprot:COSAG04_NODE_3012_length_3281_cov_1.938089_3_plen_85_part_00